MVGVPLTDPHAEGVDVLVQLIEQGDALYDHVVALVHVELDLGPAVGMGETKLRLVACCSRESFHQLCEVLSDPSNNLRSKITFRNLYQVKVKVLVITCSDESHQKVYLWNHANV